MSLSNPRRRLLQAATSLHPHTHFHPLIACPYNHQRRTALTDFFKNPFKSRRKRDILDPSSLEFLNAKKATKAKEKQERSKLPKSGRLAPGSIFDTHSPTPDFQDEQTGFIRDPKNMAAALDPTPGVRARWQRKMVIREIKARGRISKAVKLARTERSHLSRSAFFKTSVKKLFPLANQITGKPLDEAMVQMRFSKKKAAQDVLRHLAHARDQAIAIKGMGLGTVQAQAQSQPQQPEGRALDSSQDGENAPEPKPEEEKVQIQDKKGKRRVITDRTSIYVDEAWVGRGAYRREYEFRARAQVNVLRLPYTSISVVLKEEATRIRQAQERETKRQKKKVWVPLLDRPITAQRQYPLW